MSQQHSYMVITANFALESLLDQYLATYPEGEIQSYNIVYRAESLDSEDAQSYIIFNSARCWSSSLWRTRYRERMITHFIGYDIKDAACA